MALKSDGDSPAPRTGTVTARTRQEMRELEDQGPGSGLEGEGPGTGGAGECGRRGVGESVVGDTPGKKKPRSIETDRKREGGEGWRGGDGDETTRKQWKQRQRQNSWLFRTCSSVD